MRDEVRALYDRLEGEYKTLFDGFVAKAVTLRNVENSMQVGSLKGLRVIENEYIPDDKILLLKNAQVVGLLDLKMGQAYLWKEPGESEWQLARR